MRLHWKNLFIVLLAVIATGPSFAQDITGIWKGYFISEGGDYYRLEFQVQQNKKSGSVTGVSYSYADKRFYGKASMTGFYFSKTSTAQIEETKTTEVKSLTGGSTCLMNYRFTYVRSGNEEFLEGTFIAKNEDRSDPKKNGKWGDCGGGKVTLRRSIESDFYVEPFLRDKPVTKRTTIPPVKKETKPPVATKTPQTKPVAKPSVKTPAPKTNTNPVVKKPVETKNAKTDTVKRVAPPAIAKQEPAKPRPLPTISIPTVTRSRENELVQTIDVHSREVTIRLYDNGEVDDDTISVYLDKELVLSNKRLSTTPITYILRVDNEHPEHVLIMVAENLGRIPPNTSLMIVQDGDKRYQVRITSTNQKNAMVRFRYQNGG